MCFWKKITGAAGQRFRSENCNMDYIDEIKQEPEFEVKEEPPDEVEEDVSFPPKKAL